ncbi:hypothetical protein Syun_006922 [Stephania yunnanensis]|uniref:Glycoside hydrolase family 31 TIM barrel domain-containing protein n=1 Tax=Stephania yunnanensis TaxID=152371 RepID=A0AAP0KXP4_9MAGN
MFPSSLSLSPLSLTEISLPNPKSLSSLRLRLRRPVGLSDEEIYQYCLNLKEHGPSRRSTRLPSRSKHGQKFSGTEITLCTYESINNLVTGFTCFLQKVQHASHVFGSISRVEGNRWMLCLEISYEHIMLCIHALLAITLPHANLKNSFIKYVSDPDQRLVADCNLMDLDTAAVADRRGHFVVLLSKNHFKVCLVILYELLVQDRFPNPKALVNELHLNGFKAIWMLDLGIGHEEGYFVYDSGSKEDVWIQNVDGKPFVGKFKFPLIFPSTLEVSNLISASEEQYYKIRLGTNGFTAGSKWMAMKNIVKLNTVLLGVLGNILLLSEWMLVDRWLKLGLVNRFKIDEVYKCT